MILEKAKTKFSLFYILLILGILIIEASPNEVSKRFLQYNNNDNYYNYDDYNYSDPYNSNKTSNAPSFAEEPGTYLLAWFTIFFFMGLYIICTMKQYPEIASRTDDVWKFMFFANNGILVAAGINIFNVRNLILDSSPFALSSIGFIVGCVYYIVKYCQTCNMYLAFQYFECTKLGELYKLPCFIWSLKSLTDDCCRSNTYTVAVYDDGHVESNEFCVRMWNCFIYLIKRFAVIFSMISFYIFLLFYFIYWLIGKSIFILILKIKGPIVLPPQPSPPPPVVPPVVRGDGSSGELINQKNYGNQIIINNPKYIINPPPPPEPKVINNNINYNNNNFNISNEKPMNYNNEFNNNMNYNNNFVNNNDNFDKQTNPLPDKEQVEQQIYDPNAVYPKPNVDNMGQNQYPNYDPNNMNGINDNNFNNTQNDAPPPV